MGFLEFLVWMFVGKLIVDLFMSTGKVKQEVEKELEEELKDKLNAITHIVEVEQHGDQYYWYDRDTGDFIAQGKTLDDIIAVLKWRFPNHFFFLNGNHLLHGPEWKMIQLESVN